MKEVIVEVGTEGGSITLLGTHSQGGWVYSMSVDDWSPELIGEERIQHDSNVVDSWEAALKLLDQYPWFKLHPISIHAEFRQQIWCAVQERMQKNTEGSEGPLERWRELCRSKGTQDG